MLDVFNSNILALSGSNQGTLIRSVRQTDLESVGPKSKLSQLPIANPPGSRFGCSTVGDDVAATCTTFPLLNHSLSPCALTPRGKLMLPILQRFFFHM